MDYRTVGSTALAAIASVPQSGTSPATCLLQVGAARHSPAGSAQSDALLAYLPPVEAGAARGALFALTLAGADLVGGQPPAVLAAAEFARAYYGSVARNAGQALQTATHGALRHFAGLARGSAAADLHCAYVVVQEERAWIAHWGREATALILRVRTGQWIPPTAPSGAARRPVAAPRFAAPVALEPGDLLLILSRAMIGRLSRQLLRRMLLALAQHRPAIDAQSLADTLVRLAAVDGGRDSLNALVIRCQASVAPVAAQAAGWPAAYATDLRLPAGPAWNPQMLAALAAQAPAAPTVAERAAARLAPRPPVTSQGRGNAERRGAMEQWSLSSTPVIRPPAPPAGPAPHAAAAPIPAAPPLRTSPAPFRLPPAARRIPWAWLPGGATAVALALVVSADVDHAYYLLGLASLAGILLLTAFWRQVLHAPAGTVPLARAEGAGGGSAGGASQRLRAVSRNTARPGPDAVAVPAAPITPDGTPAPLALSKERLVLPNDRAVKEGCLDIVSLRDANGRITAQVVLLCPAHLLTDRSGQPDGLWVVLHDLGEDTRTATAWLAPGRARRAGRVTAGALAGYTGGPGSAVRIIPGAASPTPFTLASRHTQVTLCLDGYRFVERFRKAHLATFAVRVLTAQAR